MKSVVETSEEKNIHMPKMDNIPVILKGKEGDLTHPH